MLLPDLDGKARHRLQHVVDVMHHIVSAEEDEFALGAAERRVENRAAFRGVDDVAPHHAVDLTLHVGRLCKGRQQLHGLRRHPAFGIVEQEIVEACRKVTKTARLALLSRRKGLAHVGKPVAGMGLEFGEHGLRGGCHVSFSLAPACLLHDALFRKRQWRPLSRRAPRTQQRAAPAFRHRAAR